MWLDAPFHPSPLVARAVSDLDPLLSSWDEAFPRPLLRVRELFGFMLLEWTVLKLLPRRLHHTCDRFRPHCYH